MKIRFKILGNECTIESEAQEEYVQQVANYVGEKCKEITDATKENQNAIDTALLAALNIADELFQEREYRAREKAVVEKTIALLENKLGSL